MKRFLFSKCGAPFAVGGLLSVALGFGTYRFETVHDHIKPNPEPEIKAASLDEAISLANDYLVHACKDDGHFVYQVNLNPKVVVPDDYNVVRHAGAIYALASVYEARPREETRRAVIRASRFLRHQCLGFVPGHPDLLAVWPPVFEHADAAHQPEMSAGLGAAGLGLIALLSQEKARPGSTSIDELRALGRFIVSLQQNDGRFRDRYYPGIAVQPDVSKSLYYPGEAVLALTMLYEKDPSPLWIEKAAKGLGFLAKLRRGLSEVPADHWALLATARLLPLIDRTGSPVSRELLVAHAVQICQGILKGKPSQQKALW